MSTRDGGNTVLGSIYWGITVTLCVAEIVWKEEDFFFLIVVVPSADDIND